jgi:ABC-type multidrug transport system fused ATPase/permease subunit
MDAFRRVFKYVWPQWSKLIVVFAAAFFFGAMFSLSFVTVIPVLKVMMGSEGLHGWVNRTICQQQYDMTVQVPGLLSFEADPDAARCVEVAKVAKKGPAVEAGLRENDRILRVGTIDAGKMGSAEMLQRLAQAKKGQTLVLLVERFEPVRNEYQLSIKCEKRPFYADLALRLTDFVPIKNGVEDKMTAMTLVMIVLVVMTVVRCLGRFLQRYIGEKVVQTAVAHMREEAFGNAMRMPVAYFESQNPSDSVSRMVRDTGEVGVGLKILLGTTLVEPMKAGWLMALAFWLDWKLTLVFLVLAPPAIIAMAQFGRKIKRATKKSLQSWSMILGKLEETFGGIRVVKVYNRQGYETDRFYGINRKMLKHLFRISKADAATQPMMEVLGVFAVVAVIMLGTRWVVKEGGDPMNFLALLLALGLAAESVRKSSDIWNKVQQSNAAAERVFAFLDQPLEVEAAGAVPLGGVKRDIEFRNIWFGYPTSEKPVLKGVSAIVKAGENVAVVGPNGSGKTTLLNLLPRFYDAQKGQVLIDGVDISGVTLASLRNQIGLVTQRVITFNDTVAANIAYGKANATMDEIIAAAKRSYADEFITQLPHGYETIIGEHGAGLSGGQLQRLVIARAIVKNPPILIFDEAMSQVDAESEAKINRALEEFMHGRTSFIIAHRFSTVKSANRIIVMSDGMIEAQGRHEELIESCRLYRSLYETQLIR